MAVHAGSWFGLPDFGITEAVGKLMNKPTTYQGGSNLVGPTPQPKAYTPPSYTTTNPPGPGGAYPLAGGNKSGSVLGTSITGGGGSNQAPAVNRTMGASIDASQQSGNDAIDRDYESYMGQLGAQESALRGQAPIAEQGVENAANAQKTEWGNYKNTKLAANAEQQGTVTTQKATNLQQARDLYRQIQQQNIAQLSGSGISSSSVAEALAENLGVETARRIGSVSQSADQVIQNLQKEKANIEDYVFKKIQEVDQQKETQKASIRQQLQAGIDQINASRNASANDRANRRQELLMAGQSAYANLEANAQNFQQSLELWKQQQQGNLDAATNKDWTSIFSGMVQNAPAINGFTFTPEFNVNASGQTSYGGKYTPNKAVDPLEAIYQQAGVTATQ